MKTVNGLRVFPRLNGLPQTEEDQIKVLRSDLVCKVICFSLGPEGTNIAQASRAWLKRMGVARNPKEFKQKLLEEFMPLVQQMLEKAGVLPPSEPPPEEQHHVS